MLFGWDRQSPRGRSSPAGLQPARHGALALREDCDSPSCRSSAGCGRREGSGQVGRPSRSQLLPKSWGQDGGSTTRPQPGSNWDSPVPLLCQPANNLSSRLWWEGSVQSSVTGQMKPWAGARGWGCHWNRT